VHCPGELLDRPFDIAKPPALVVVHRQRLTAVDAQRLKDYRVSSVTGEPPVIALCIGPYVRHEELERWSSLADLVISEATAIDILPRHVKRLAGRQEDDDRRPRVTGFLIEVVSDNFELGQSIVDACIAAGYRARLARQIEGFSAHGQSRRPVPSVDSSRTITVWDVPVLEPDWQERLERRTRLAGPLIALIGFADRDVVTAAKACGAVACLELPYNIDDLVDVIDRASRSLSAARTPMPARVEPPHRLPPPPLGRRKRQDPVRSPVPWSDREGKPRVD
jgi:FixJ family two-component response regulator